MNKVKKLSACVLISAALVMCMSMSALAKSDWLVEFSGTLPANQGDAQVSTIKKEFETEYFTVNMTSIGNNYKNVCAWTENTLGANYSDPSNQVHLNEFEQVGYDSVPKVGRNVVLNLDNPVKTESTVAVQGRWSPD